MRGVKVFLRLQVEIQLKLIKQTVFLTLSVTPSRKENKDIPDTCRGFMLCIRYINTEITKEALCLSSKKMKFYLSVSSKGKKISQKDYTSWNLEGRGEAITIYNSFKQKLNSES